MPDVAALRLPHLPLADPAFEADPAPFIAAARAEHPWLAASDFGYYVHGYRAIRDMVIMDRQLAPNHEGAVQFYQADGTPWARYMREMILALSGPKHVRIRASVGDAFTPRNINRNIALMREVVEGLLDEWVPKGGFDFTEFASYFPIAVMCGLLGTSKDDIPMIRDALETQSRVFSLDLGIRDELIAGYDVLWDYCDRLIRVREAEGIDRAAGLLLDSLIAAQHDGKIDDIELRFLLMVLFPAGYDTSKNMLGFTLQTMIDHPALWERCAEDLPYCYRAVDERLRYSSVISPFRAVVEPFDHDGVHFPEGTVMIFGLSLACRDPAFFDDAGEYLPERSAGHRHIAFGRGAHICLGQHLARTQIAEAIHLIARRVKKPRLTGEVRYRPYLGIWGLESLPIEFERA
jgi:cytochrome P450